MPGFVDDQGNVVPIPAPAPPPGAMSPALIDAILAAPQTSGPTDPTMADGIPAPSGIPNAPPPPPVLAPPPVAALGPPPPPVVRHAPPPAAAVAPPGQPPLGELMSAATSPADSGGDPVDRELAAARATPPAPKPGDLGASATRVAGTEAEQEAALKRQGEVEASNAAREAEAKQAMAREAERRTAIQEQARAESDRAVQAAREKAQGAPFHTFWSDKTHGQRALAMIGIMLGGVSWDKNHRNQAAESLDATIARDFEKQKDEHAELWKNVESAMQQGQALRSNQLQEMGQFRLNQALQLEAVGAESTRLAAYSKNEVGLAALRNNNAKLGFARDQAFEEARRLMQAAAVQERQGDERLRIERGHLGVARAAAGAGKANAEELKVAGALDRQLSRDKVTSSRLAARDKLDEAKGALATGNPAAIQAAIDGYLRSATGLGARPQSIKMFQERLGGAVDQLRAWVEEKKTGGLPPTMIKRFQSAIEGAYDENTTALKTSRALHEKALLSSPEYARHKDLVKAHLDDRFSAVSDQAGGAPADPMREKAQRALSDPRAPPAAKEAARRYLGQ